MSSQLYVVPSQVLALHTRTAEFPAGETELVILFKGGEQLIVSEKANKHYDDLLPKVREANPEDYLS